MERRELGQSDITVPPMIFGAWAIGGWMWGGQDHDDAVAAIRTALAEGIDAFDTAAIYGFGHSEELLAEALQHARREDVVILTKFGLRWDAEPGQGTARWETQDNEGNDVTVVRYASPESVKLECERSLKRLNTDYIDVYQIHWPDDTTPIEETFGAVKELLEEGKIRAAGVSNYTPEQMARAQTVVPLASSQPPYSMVLRDAEADILPWCSEHHVGVINYSPLQRGLLTGKFDPDKQFPEGDHRAGSPLFSPENIRRVNAFLHQIEPIAEAHDASVAQLVINWTSGREDITAPIVGARNENQARENAHAVRFTLTDGERRQIDEALDNLQLQTK